MFYLAPDGQTPSWGVATLYQHVELLRRQGIRAFILNGTGLSLRWTESTAPVQSMVDPDFCLATNDVLVIPEIYAFTPHVASIKCRKIVFVQNAFLATNGDAASVDYEAQNYECAIVPMPHLKRVVERYHHSTVHTIPYALPQYSFHDPSERTTRAKVILVYPKQRSRDYVILEKILSAFLPQKHPEWTVTVLKDRTHHEVLDLMKKSSFFVNVNCYEAFNTTVPEAMAAGCVCLCYEAFGGRDFLVHGENAYVFKNNDIYPLLDTLFAVLDGLTGMERQIESIRANAFRTASAYTEEKLATALSAFYDGMFSGLGPKTAERDSSS